MKRRVHPHEKTGELNIVPYLDIMVNLTMFMLVSMTSVIQFGVLNVVAPPIGPSAASSASPDQPKKELQLSVLIGTKGFFLASANGILADSKGDPKAPIDTKVAAPTIPLKADGKFDYETLTKKMVDIKHQFKDERKVTISADKTVAYEVLVQTMDAVRNDGPEKLFDLVQLGAL
jgi:biopolymer transport protein ExbD